MTGQDTAIAEAIAYMESHLADRLCLDAVANAVHYSKYHLHHRFQDAVGLTIHEYIRRRRLTEAARALTDTHRSILDIALSAGYESQQSFSSAFKMFYKCSPGQYREGVDFYPLQLPFRLIPRPIRNTNFREPDPITFAVQEDLDPWMELVRLVVGGYPRLYEPEYRIALKRYMENGQALIAKTQDGVAGGLMIEANTGGIAFLGIHPQYRRSGLSRALLRRAIREFSLTDGLWVTTFREGDRADTGYREGWKHLGFTEAEQLVEFGYPTQRFILSERGGRTLLYE